MVFGLKESGNERIRNKVDYMLGCVYAVGTGTIRDCFRVGGVKQGTMRPVKVLFLIAVKQQP